MISKDFLELVVKEIVHFPDEVRVERITDELGVLMTLFVNPKDMGIVIGRGGETIESIRKIFKIIGFKENSVLNIKVHDPKKQ